MIKKILVLIMVIGIVCVTIPASAAVIGFGVESDFTINKDVKASIEGSDVNDASYSAQHYDLVADIAINDSLTISPKLGLTKIQFDEESIGESKSDLGSNYGVDAKLKIYSGAVDIALLGKYRYSITKFKGQEYLYSWDGEEWEYLGSSEFSIKGKLHEYEIGPIVSKTFGENIPVTPYVGVVYSGVNGRLISDFPTVKVKAQDNIGLRLGTKVKLMSNINLFVDGALLDKQGVSAKVTYTF